MQICIVREEVCTKCVYTFRHIYTPYLKLHCSTLQHTATYCNTLQRPATYCNTLPHTATHCNILQYTAPHCNILQHTTTHCNTLQHIRGCASAVLHVYNMIELVHAKWTHTYAMKTHICNEHTHMQWRHTQAAARRLSGMPVGCATVTLSVFQNCLSLLKKGRCIIPPTNCKLGDCTTMRVKAPFSTFSYSFFLCVEPERTTELATESMM